MGTLIQMIKSRFFDVPISEGFSADIGTVSYTLPRARTRSDAPPPINPERTYVVVTTGHHKGRGGYIKGTFARAQGVSKVFVFFAAPFPGDAPEVHKIFMSALRVATQTELTFQF